MTSPAANVFLKACRREKTPYTPVWFMRQAGRYMKEYRRLREKVPFLELCKDPDLASGITVRAQELLKADAAILFSDILLVVEAMGLPLDFSRGDGPRIGRRTRGEADVRRLLETDPRESLPFVFEAVRRTRRKLKPGVPLIGFAGAPFTVASYIVEGGASKDFALTRGLMKKNPAVWRLLMEKITRITRSYLAAQIEAGVDAVQVFDSWVGCLQPAEYKAAVLPHSRRLLKGLSGAGDGKDGKVPVIHFGTFTGPFLESFAGAGGDVIGVDHRVPLDDAWKRVGIRKAIQGNLDPSILAHASLKKIEREIRLILEKAARRPGHIFNLGHGVLPDTPLEHVQAAVEMVHAWSTMKEPRLPEGHS